MQDLNADEVQDYFLQGVSRTFALTIPVLPYPLRRVVANAYLQCRIIDTIEDDPGLTLDQKQDFVRQFTQVLAGDDDPYAFAEALYPLLSSELLDLERELIRETPRIMSINQELSKEDRAAILRCVKVMGPGMLLYQQRQSRQGLSNLQDMEDYCYYVAGVVGEMLTEVYGNHVPEIKKHREQLLPLARSFGQGLQMTNILKDVWEDLQRGVCWLPAEVFSNLGYSLDRLSAGESDLAYEEGINSLIALAHFRLKEALFYTLNISTENRQIRLFNLWSLAMAMLTLRKIHRHPGYSSGEDVKISRKSVSISMLMMKWVAGNDRILKLLFAFAGRGLPCLQEAAPPRVPELHQQG